MRAIFVDDEKEAIAYFQKQIKDIEGLELVQTFTNPVTALNYVKNGQEVDLAILDINMPGMDGIMLSFQLRTALPDILIMFITAEESTAANMIRVHPDAILFKPYLKEEVENSMQKMMLLKQKREIDFRPLFKTPLFFRTFGRFDVFNEGKLVAIHNRKVKELMALFVQANGGSISTEYAISTLWPERPYDTKTQSLYRVTVSSLKKLLESMECEGILVDVGRCKAFDSERYDSDYQQMLKGNAEYIELYNGKFMTEYSWAEDTAALLDNVYYSYEKKRGKTNG